MRTVGKPSSQGFSLIEMVIVVAIIAIIGAIALPRMSRGGVGAADSNLVGSLAILRGAIDLYAAEHNGAFPNAAHVEAALLTFSDDFGNTNSVKSASFIYGPYLRKVPSLPVGTNKGQSGIAGADGPNVGWIYNASTGAIIPNCSPGEVDARGVEYRTY